MTDFTKIASFYDLMTGYSRRLVNDFGKIKHLVQKYDISSVLDAGCGSGVHSIILSKLDLDVIGLDASDEMIKRARINAKNEGANPEFVREFYESMPEDWTDRFDGLFCLGNSLVGVGTMARLSLALKSFKRVIKPGGHAIIQLLNFEYFIHHHQRIIKISNEENITFVRFLDIEEKETRLNVIAIERELGELNHRFISEIILPITTEMLKTAAADSGFSDISFYSDLTLTTDYSLDAPNLVVDLTA